MKQKLYKNQWFLFGVFVLSAIVASVFYAMRCFWVFYSPKVAFMGGAWGVFALMCAVCVLSLTLFALRYYNVKKNATPLGDKKWFCVLCAVSLGLTLLCVAGVIGVLAISGTETVRTALLYYKHVFPWLGLVLFVALTLLVLPRLKGKSKAVLSVVLAVCALFALICRVFPAGSYTLVSDPAVFDTGTDYAVVFGTNAPGTAYVKYTYEGTEYTVYAQRNGKLISGSTVHSVNVPYEHLKNNSYRVGGERVIESYGYGSRLGKSTESKPYTLRVNVGDTQTYLTVSDWHTYTDMVYDAAAALGEYDAVLLMGDAAGGMDCEELALEYIVKFAGNLTRGEKPAVFVRGNHDTRGEYAAELPDAIGYKSLYYTVSSGPYTFIVLDSGEDKPDGHAEYGGMDRFAESRAGMLEWLRGLDAPEGKVIALSHAWQVSEPEPEVSNAVWNELSRLGARFVIAGHEHECRFVDGGKEDAWEREVLSAFPGITAYIDGGHHGSTYIATRLTLSPEGVRFQAADQTGKSVLDTVLPWEPDAGGK